MLVTPNLSRTGTSIVVLPVVQEFLRSIQTSRLAGTDRFAVSGLVVLRSPRYPARVQDSFAPAKQAMDIIAASLEELCSLMSIWFTGISQSVKSLKRLAM